MFECVVYPKKLGVEGIPMDITLYNMMYIYDHKFIDTRKEGEIRQNPELGKS